MALLIFLKCILKEKLSFMYFEIQTQKFYIIIIKKILLITKFKSSFSIVLIIIF
jgi:hypothetical protein